MRKVQERPELLERVDDALTRSISAKQMLAVAKRTTKAAQASVGQVNWSQYLPGGRHSGNDAFTS